MIFSRTSVILSVVVCDKFISFVVLLVSICQRLRASVDNGSFLEFSREDFCEMFKGEAALAKNCKLLFAGCFVIPDLLLSTLNIIYRVYVF